MTGLSRKGAAPSRLGQWLRFPSPLIKPDMRICRGQSDIVHVGLTAGAGGSSRGQPHAGCRRRRPRERRARRARRVGRAVIARSPCDEAIQGRRHVRRQGAADGSGVASGLLRRFAPRNDGTGAVSLREAGRSRKVRIAVPCICRSRSHVGRAVIARSPCDEAVQGRRHVRRQGAADGSAVASGLLRRFAPRNDGRAIPHAKSA
jgi:hypothetical protein